MVAAFTAASRPGIILGPARPTHREAATVPNPTRSELGDFLRSRRERLSPDALGLPSLRRRRTAGLRREEVAERAGIGVDWYTRLEQGRSVSPSATTIDALARALGLDAMEHAHLRALTRNSGNIPFVRETVPEGLARMLAGLAQPAYITGLRWDLLAWNDAADAVFGFSRLKEDSRNILHGVLTNRHTRALFGAAWEDHARRMVAQFRTTYDLWAGDPAFEALLAQLRQDSAEFPAWWEAHDIGRGGAGQKSLHHPRKGLLRFDYATFQANDDPALKLAIYTPAAGASRTT
jgi:transcriptional regulator with XRE-family HTH domain